MYICMGLGRHVFLFLANCCYIYCELCDSKFHGISVWKRSRRKIACFTIGVKNNVEGFSNIDGAGCNLSKRKENTSRHIGKLYFGKWYQVICKHR